MHHEAIFDENDVLMTGFELPSHITSRHYSQSSSSYVTAPAHCRSSFVSSDSLQALATLWDETAGSDTRKDVLVRVFFCDHGQVPLYIHQFDGYPLLQRIKQKTGYVLINIRALFPFTNEDERYNS